MGTTEEPVEPIESTSITGLLVSAYVSDTPTPIPVRVINTDEDPVPVTGSTTLPLEVDVVNTVTVQTPFGGPLECQISGGQDGTAGSDVKVYVQNRDGADAIAIDGSIECQNYVQNMGTGLWVPSLGAPASDYFVTVNGVGENHYSLPDGSAIPTGAIGANWFNGTADSHFKYLGVTATTQADDNFGLSTFVIPH